MINMLRTVIDEYGLMWSINRGLYALKIETLKKFPSLDILFEKKVNIKRINIFDFNIKEIETFLSNLSVKEQQSIINIADDAIEGIITGFSSIKLDFGNPINWHMNPITGHANEKQEKWFKIPDFDKQVGDIKVIWEASRLTHFLYFTRAYMITKDRKYYDAFSKQLHSWLENNKYSYGSNYKDGQEASLRMFNLLISYTVFNYFNLITEEDRQNVFSVVEGSYKKIKSNFFYAYRCIKNNHTFTEILGLIVGAWCSEDNNDLKKAYRLMDEEIVKQFTSDGGFTQYSFNYHRFTLQIFEYLFKVSEKTGINIQETERIKNSVLLLYQLQSNKGEVPNYGSNDGALIFPLTVCDYTDYRPVLNTVYALLTGKKLYHAGNYDEELLWFANTNKFPVDNILREDAEYDEIGYYILRHDEGYMLTTLQDFQSRPAHMDQLHIDLWHKGTNVFCDTGTYSYASKLNEELSSTIGHNTVKLSGIEQMNKYGAFLVTNWTEKIFSYYDEKRFKGKFRSGNDYEHERIITKTKKGYLIEDILSSQEDKVNIIFHTPCEVAVHDNFIFLLRKNIIIAKIKTQGSINITQTYRSRYYLKKEKITRLIISHEKDAEKTKFETEIFLND